MSEEVTVTRPEKVSFASGTDTCDDTETSEATARELADQLEFLARNLRSSLGVV